MMYEPRRRPFTQMLRNLRRDGARYQDLVNRSGEARSSSWFNNLLNAPRSPWVVAPPDPEAWPGLARLLDVSEPHLREAIAQEWYGVGDDSFSTDARRLAEAVEALDEGDRSMVAAFAQRLAEPRATESELLDRSMRDLDELIQDRHDESGTRGSDLSRDQMSD